METKKRKKVMVACCICCGLVALITIGAAVTKQNKSFAVNSKGQRNPNKKRKRTALKISKQNEQRESRKKLSTIFTHFFTQIKKGRR